MGLFYFVETVSEQIYSKVIAIGSNLRVKDLYANRHTRNKWRTFIMVTKDNKGEFLDC